MSLIKLSLLTLIFVGCFGVARAQEPAATPTPTASTTATQTATQTASPAPSPAAEVSTAKRALIKEMLDITNSRESAEGLFAAQFDEIQKQMPDIVWQSISSMDEYKKLSSAQQEELRTKMRERSARFSQHVKELFLARIDMKQLIDDISYVIYDKHFTEAELKDLVAFYGSDTGKKVIREMPALVAESIAKAGDFIGPKVKDIVEDSQRSETADLAKEIEKILQARPRTPAKKTTRRRP